MKKGFVFFFLLFFFFNLAANLVFAKNNFKTDYSVTYNVLENALTHVTFDVTFTNSTSQYYASSYSIQVGFKNIENVLARDPDGKIIPLITKNNDGNNIEINFNKKVVGLDQKLPFAISFDTRDIAQKSGKIWDINIPGLAKQIEYNTFNVEVIVPKFLGSPSYIKPDIGKFVGANLNFTKEELGESGISISFGNEEIYNFDLLYHLKNSNLFPIKTEIALPPSTNYQEVKINDIDPKPINVIQDGDGNWLAQYILTPSKELDIRVKGKAKILLRPKKVELSDDELKQYLKEQPYWQTSKKEIKDLALKLKTPYTIYKYVVDNLIYDFDRVENSQPRVGALEVLKNPDSAVCLEFTDLFIALARAAGIPAREVNGFAYTQNEKERPLSLIKDVLHAWPEYYDSDIKTWVMVDPTWGNTTGGVDYFYTLDFDHFAFIIKGVNSTYPIPAGGYKISGDDKTKDINIEFGDDFKETLPTLSFGEDFSNNYFSAAMVTGNVLIKNVGSVISNSQSISITTDFLKPQSQKIYFGKIPPFGSISIPVALKSPSILTNKKDNIRIALNENYLSKEVKISLFILNEWTIGGGILFVSIIFAITIIIYKARNLLIFKRKG
ncbi:MAG: transglutaminase family protein [Candidatus Levybacteria bacterium]|nr:transglutaminase family protein [Candidatus Levybacteria bacterium]